MDGIAVVGLSCLFPRASTPVEFWENLVNGRDCTSLATAAQMGVDPAVFHAPGKGVVDKYYNLRGGYVGDVRFDPEGYAIAPEILAGLDPLFTWPLYVAREALRDAGLGVPDLARCGLVLGSLSFPTSSSHRLVAPLYYRAVESAIGELLDRPHFKLLQPWAGEDPPSPYNALLSGFPASVVARAISLGGPSFGLDAACATSLYAVKLAARYLLAGQADLMLAGAVSAADTFFMNMGFSIFQAYPETGEASRPLDSSSRGLISGEGAGMLVLKRYEDARRDGDRIYALIRGVGLSNDGRGRHPLAPNPRGQLLAFERAYGESGVDPASVSYVECHATGTPLGDVTELNTMEEFFGARQAAPLLGAVKSNHGHLLTAAGMAGLIKAILSLEHGLIPPTIHLEAPLSSQRGLLGGRQIVAATTQVSTGPGVRAAVSAFGFGGANAHAVLERPSQTVAVSADRTASPPAPLPHLAIVGMDATFGGADGLNALASALYRGAPLFAPPGHARWRGLGAGDPPPGAYVEQLELDWLRLKLPPNPADQPIPQQLLMLQVADRALRDAGLCEGANVAVIIALGTDLSLHEYRGRVDLSWQIRASLEAAGIELAAEDLAELERIAMDSVHPPGQVNRYTSFIGNITASRISALWDFTGPSFTVSAEEISAFRALELARLLLGAGEVEAVLIGAVDLAGGVEHVLTRGRLEGPGPVGEGAGALVLKRCDDAERDGDRAYARLEALRIVGGAGDRFPPGLDPEAVARACQEALAEAGRTAAEVGYLECASSVPSASDPELLGVARGYGPAAAEPGCGLGSAGAAVGRTGAAAGVASLLRAALCLSERYLPAWPADSPPELPAAGLFYVPAEPRPWLTEHRADRRLAAVNGVAIDGSFAHAILAESARPRQRGGTYLADEPFFLFPVAGDTEQGLLEQVQSLEHDLLDGSSLGASARSCFARYRTRSDGWTYVAAIVGGDRERLLRELRLASEAIPPALAGGGEWSTPLGSYFSARPLGPRGGKVAFVYPGAYNGYLGLGSDLLHLNPELHERLAAITEHPARSVVGDLLYPRARGPLTSDRRQHFAGALQRDAVGLIQTGTTFAVLTTTLLCDCFKLEPDLAFGYSMGESTMMWALGVWDSADESSRRLHASPLFRTRLVGPKEAGRELLGLPPDGDDEGGFWSTVVLKAPVGEVEASARRRRGVFLTQINTPNEVVISGLTEECRDLIGELGCHSVRAPVSVVNHCPAIRTEYDAYVALHTFPIASRPTIDLYSQATFAPTRLESATIARNVADGCCVTVDFPRLVRRVYDAGARIFVELGPGSTCAGYVDEILAGADHVALSLNKRGIDDHRSIVRALARLVSHRVALDLSPLYTGIEEIERDQRSAGRAVVVGGPSVREAILSEASRRRFKPVPARIEAAVPVARPLPLPRAPERAVALARPGPHAAEAHLAFLQARLEGLQQLGELLRLQAGLLGAEPPGGAPPTSPQPATRAAILPPAANGQAVQSARAGVVWDTADLLEFAEGQIDRVFGPEYAVIDAYRRRVRLPMPPYLLVSRVTRLQAQRGRFEPCSLTTEYDIPSGAWYLVDGQAPLAVTVESGQCDLLLISYLGIDFENRGERVYRLLDCTLTFLDELPGEGDTLRYDIRINDFARSGDNLLFFFSYECFVGDRMILKMDGGCAGFFADDELDRGRGVIVTEAEQQALASVTRRYVAPLLACSRASFDGEDLRRLGRGDLAAVFGPEYEQDGLNRSLRLPDSTMLMLDRVTDVDPRGGRWGLGRLVAEKDLQPDAWYFTCHFKDDPVLAGSLVADGCAQLLQLYLLHLGFQTRTRDARFQPIRGLPQVVRCRGQVIPTASRLTYVMEVTDLGVEPAPYARANVDVVLDGKTIVAFKDLGVEISEQAPPLPSPPATGAQRGAPQSAKAPLFDQRQIEEFALGSISACFGPEYALYDTRRAPRTPNGELMLISRVREVQGRRGEVSPGSSLVAEYDLPADAWFCRENAYPSPPYSVYMEIALQPCGFLSAYLGSTLPYPDEDFYFRNLDGAGRLLSEPELRGRTISNRVRLLSSDALDGVIVQKFEFQLACAGQVFYKGEAVFGYFRAEALVNQVGLDAGREVSTWYAENGAVAAGRLDLRPDAAGRRPLRPRPALPHYRLPEGRLSLVDEIVVVPDGGDFGQGYLYARADVDPSSWFFRCHFHQDPVMPGSLGVEAVLQALQAYALELDLGRSLAAPRFAQATGHQIRWKYRGQFVPHERDLRLEAHLKRAEATSEGLLLLADASLWKGTRRVYELRDAAIDLLEG